MILYFGGNMNCREDIRQMIVYFSGAEDPKTPTHIMLSFAIHTNKNNRRPNAYFRSIIKSRKRLMRGETPLRDVKQHFFDSGAFSLWSEAAKYAKEHHCHESKFYDTDEHWQYLKEYADFVKKYSFAIDLYANVDVIPSKVDRVTFEPELTWRNQQHLEKEFGLTPIPVVHFKTPMRWLEHYIEQGYTTIGLGGLVGSTVEKVTPWLNSCFEVACDTPDRCPRVKLHGFGITSYELMIRWPWWSVDSTSWLKEAAYGGLYVPHKRRGKFTFDTTPYVLKVSVQNSHMRKENRHVLTLRPGEKKIIEEWIEQIGFKFGTWDKDGSELEEGVCTSRTMRMAANVAFFEAMQDAMPKWPYPFHSQKRKGFGLLHQ